MKRTWIFGGTTVIIISITYCLSGVDNSYYNFSEDGKECIIKRYDTPVPWMNRLGNDRLVAWVSHNGNIVESCLLHNKDNRLTNPKSGYVYIRDASTGDYFMLNKPKAGGAWQSVQGLGYTSVMSSYMGVTAQATYFSPREDDVLIWLLSLSNDSEKKRTLDVYSLVEWCLGDEYYDTVFPGGDFYGILNNFKRVDFENNILFAKSYVGLVKHPARFMGQMVWPYTGFLTSNLPVQSFDCTQYSFFGRSKDLENPEAVKNGFCPSQSKFGFTDFPLGVLQNSVELAPGQEKKLVIILGIVKENAETEKLRKKYLDPKMAEKAFHELKSFWTNYMSPIHIDTPDNEIDRLVNIWIKYQHRASMLQNLNTGRIGWGIWCPAYPYGGGRTSDIRETGNVPLDLELIKDDLLDFLQKPGPLMLEGDLKRKWTFHFGEGKPHPPIDYANDGRSLWPRPVCWYIKETGDFSILETKVPGSEDTIFDRMKRKITKTLESLSDRGLARMNAGFGDWNDAMNFISRSGKGESVLSSMEICLMLKHCIEIADAYGQSDLAKQWQEKYDLIKSAINQYAWDGQWYLRAFTDEGTAVGSSEEQEGRIYLTTQALAILSGVANPERAKKSLQSVDALLMTEIGPMIKGPPYTQPNYQIGIGTDFGPGWRENGGIWNRPTGWAVMANCLANRTNEAFDMFSKASVHNAAKNIDRFWMPPYAFCEYYVGAGPDFGRGQYQWCMGKAGTMWRAYVYYILGVRPELDGLLVDPKIPNDWDGFRLTRPFRGATYQIEVANPNQVNRGVKKMVVDGQMIKGNIIPPHMDGKAHIVKVILGN